MLERYEAAIGTGRSSTSTTVCATATASPGAHLDQDHPAARRLGPQGAQAWRPPSPATAQALRRHDAPSGSRHEWQAACDLIVTMRRHERDLRGLPGRGGGHRVHLPRAQAKPLHRPRQPLRGRRQGRQGPAHPGRPRPPPSRHRTHRCLLGTRPLRARLRNPPEPPGQGTQPRRQHRDRGRQPLWQTARPQPALRNKARTQASAFVALTQPDQVDEVVPAHKARGRARQHRVPRKMGPPNPRQPGQSALRQGHGPGARVSRRHTRPLPRTPMPRPLQRRWRAHRRPNPAGRVSRFDAACRRPVDKWTAAPRLTTSPQGNRNNRSGQSMCYRNRPNTLASDTAGKSGAGRFYCSFGGSGQRRWPTWGLAISFSMWQCGGHGNTSGTGWRH